MPTDIWVMEISTDIWLIGMPTDILNQNLLSSHLVHENMKVHTSGITILPAVLYVCVKLGLSYEGKNKG
jgi:hypothetical protein